MAPPTFTKADLAAWLRTNPSAAAGAMVGLRDDVAARLEATVAAGAELATIDTTALSDGQLVRTQAPRALWTFVRSEDGGGAVLWGEALAPGGGDGRAHVHSQGRIIYDPASPPVLNGTGTVRG